MKRYKGLMLSLAFILVLSTALAGCGSSQNAAETTGDTQGTENNADADEKITLTFLHNTPKSEINQGEGKTFYAQMDKFRAKHPNVEIKDEGYPSADYRTKIKTLAAANELPDMFFLEASLVPNFADNGLIEPINDIVENADWTENFMNDAFDDMTYNGDIYGIPSDMKATSLIFYNKEIFAEAGITSFPETWEEFKEAVVKLKDAGYIPIAMGNKDKWVLESCLLSTLGDRYTGPEWFYNARDGKEGASFTDAAFVDSLKAVKELVDMGAFNSDMNSIDHNAQRTLYYNKKAAMFFEGAWAVSAVVNDAPEDVLNATDLALVPKVGGGNGEANAVSGGTSYGYTINPALTGKKREIAIELIEALTGEGYATMLKENSGFPVYVPQDFDNSKLPKLTQRYFEVTGEASFTPIYDMKLPPAAIEAMNSGLQELTIGAKTPEQLAQDIQTALENAQ